eukprot:1571523-Rhodomonas_salina.1
MMAFDMCYRVFDIPLKCVTASWTRRCTSSLTASQSSSARTMTSYPSLPAPRPQTPHLETLVDGARRVAS